MRFKKTTDELRKSIRYEVRMTEKDAAKIHHSASIRQMSIAEFMRRAALGRRADVRYETEIVLALRDVVMVIRALHANFVDQKIPPPEALLRPVISEAINAMLRIQK